MESNERKNKIYLNLSSDEALILFDWLSRFNEGEHTPFFQDQAEERVLFDLEAILEKSMKDILDSEYQYKLLKARERIRDLK